MKKTLILAAFGLLASLAPPAFAANSGTYIGPNDTTLQTAKASPTTFVIAERVDKAKERPRIVTSAKSAAKDDYMLKRIDSGPTAPGLITASHDKVKGGPVISSSMKRDNKGGGVLAFDTKAPQVGLDLKTAPMTSASAQDKAMIGAGNSNVTT